ncbi:tRNA (guanine(46)-N(7))-methyltransferase TrmB [Chitinimonas lacunae]|uniref:tRNA (guanine(46)-N(7))-methyltransferase n=1 Tax=Chitinimonas lacunae TaxID=1963018 RepID=A0ABV8MQU8_9NEIS
MDANSRPISSAQTGPHEKLLALVERHARHPFQRPIADYNRVAFEQAMVAWGGRQPLVLDAGCGVGRSTIRLAHRHRDCFVLGVDQSADRLGRGKDDEAPADNYALVRADLVDFWRLLRQHGVTLAHHYLLYPNPWPKIGQLSRRWQGHPVLPELLALGGRLECRSNWRLYVEELALAVGHLTGCAMAVERCDAGEALTPFERKYRDSGQTLWRGVADLASARRVDAGKPHS